MPVIRPTCSIISSSRITLFVVEKKSGHGLHLLPRSFVYELVKCWFITDASNLTGGKYFFQTNQEPHLTPPGQSVHLGLHWTICSGSWSHTGPLWTGQDPVRCYIHDE